MSDSIDIDFEFIRKVEGKQQLKAYVPVCTAASVVNTGNKVCYGKPEGTVIGKSGVTIATGFDVGQHTVTDLQRLGLDTELVTKLTPFAKLTKESAVSALQTYQKKNHAPFTITHQEAAQVDLRVKMAFYSRLRSRIEKKYGTSTFDNLPTQAKTVLFSMYYQFGLNSTNQNVVAVTDLIMKHDYSGAVEKLRSITSYSTRRKEEARILEKAPGYPGAGSKANSSSSSSNSFK